MANQQAQAFEDLRNTVHECSRILRHRWRLGLVGLCVVSSAAFWCSQYLPREYTASTMFERRDDVVLQNLIHSNSPYGFEHLKATMAMDMTGSRALAKALVNTGLSPAGAFPGTGALSEQERATLDSVLSRYNAQASVKLTASTPSLDTILLRCDANDPQVAHRLVVALRDNYMADTRERIREILTGTRDFFQGEIARLRGQVAQTDDGLRKEGEDLLGVDPTDLTSLGNRLEMVRTERNNTYQHTAELEAQIAAREQFLTTGPSVYGLGSVAPTSAPTTGAAAGPVGDSELERTIRTVQTQIVEALTVKRMTPEHPTVRGLFDRLRVLQELRDSSLITVEVAPRALLSPEWTAQQLRVELELDTLRRQLGLATRQLAEADGRVQRIEALYNSLLGNGDELQKLRDQRTKSAAELGEWEGHLTRLERVMAAETGDRGTQFALIEEPDDAVRPTRPRIASIFVVCSGLGLAAAALLAALAELFDRSFRSVGQVTRTIGVPVLECISVIATPRERRRTLISRLVWTPTLAALLLSLVATAGLAYASIELPAIHQRAVQRVDHLLGTIGLAWVAAGESPAS